MSKGIIIIFTLTNADGLAPTPKYGAPREVQHKTESSGIEKELQKVHGNEQSNIQTRHSRNASAQLRSWTQNDYK